MANLTISDVWLIETSGGRGNYDIRHISTYASEADALDSNTRIGGKLWRETTTHDHAANTVVRVALQLNREGI